MTSGRLERCLIDEADLITGLPARTLQSVSVQGQIPSAAKLGRRWTYDIVRLREWVSACEHATTRGAALSASEINAASVLGQPSINERLQQAIARNGERRRPPVEESTPLGEPTGSAVLDSGRTPSQWCNVFSDRGIDISERTLRAKARSLGAFHRIGSAMLITPAQIDIILENGACHLPATSSASHRRLPPRRYWRIY